MSYCIECYYRGGHAPGCPEYDGYDYDEDNDYDGDDEPETDLNYDVEWDGSRLKCVRM